MLSTCFKTACAEAFVITCAGPAKQAKQATAKAASSVQQSKQEPAGDLGKQLSNVIGGLKLPWQQGSDNGTSSKQQQVWVVVNPSVPNSKKQ